MFLYRIMKKTLSNQYLVPVFLMLCQKAAVACKDITGLTEQLEWLLSMHWTK